MLHVTVVERDNKPELLVRFKSNVDLAQIKRITAALNDRVDDNYEAINGLTAIDDLDYADVSLVLRQYEEMTDLVEYAEPNFEIALDDSVDRNSRPAALSPNPVGAPNDPLFGDQWALNNTGQNGGKANAHIDALKAWAKTQGSSEVVVAVLDTGVDYSHKDLVENMWIRPASLPQYVDNELGSIDDIHGYDANVNAGDPMGGEVNLGLVEELELTALVRAADILQRACPGCRGSTHFPRIAPAGVLAVRLGGVHGGGRRCDKRRYGFDVFRKGGDAYRSSETGARPNASLDLGAARRRGPERLLTASDVEKGFIERQAFD